MCVEGTSSKDADVGQALSHGPWCCRGTLNTGPRCLFYVRRILTTAKTPSASMASHETAAPIPRTHWTLIAIWPHRHGLI